MIETPPKLSKSDLSRAISLYGNPRIMTLIQDINDEYLYWSDVKYKKDPAIANPQELWALVHLSRQIQKAFEWPKFGAYLSLTNHMQKVCHEIDMQFGGSWGSSSIIPKNDSEIYLVNSLMDEAIASSQIEGASSTRKVAKEMLRKQIKPRSRSEQMISNNYNAINFIVEHKDDTLSPELILKLHGLMTHNTLDNPRDEGCFRQSDDIVVQNEITGEIVHYPPKSIEIEDFIKDLCKFANEEKGERFIHPVIKAIIIHYMIAYVHPFVDGNGRTARALFYWYMLKNGYWLTQYLTISTVIYKSKPSYERSFLYGENDGNDMGYFITYNLHVLEQAFDGLKNYIQKKIKQKQESLELMQDVDLTERQRTILSYFVKNPYLELTATEVSVRCMVTHPTAQSDINVLVGMKLLKKVPVNKKQNKYIKGEEFDKMMNGPSEKI